jgi:hypothetical protein
MRALLADDRIARHFSAGNGGAIPTSLVVHDIPTAFSVDCIASESRVREALNVAHFLAGAACSEWGPRLPRGGPFYV